MAASQVGLTPMLFCGCCGTFYRQIEAAWRAPFRGDKKCANLIAPDVSNSCMPAPTGPLSGVLSFDSIRASAVLF